ncbi:MAG: PDZ domain-containing protein, partial [Planctomycetes bacterium]|nr:PDZ domain-containing protein [Planctomycetota bacterium]
MRVSPPMSFVAVGLFAAGALALGLSAPVAPEPAAALRFEPTWADAFQWRSIGPANMGGRITDISVYEADPTIYYVATASGGLLKTTNNGVTYEHQFDDQATVSIGAVAVAPSDPDIVWVGTGEANPRNSVSWGDGVYKSTDGGDTWQNMGLKETFQIGQVVIHPKNPDIVYIGAMGRCWGDNEQRGLFKTTDGGENWDKVLYIDEATGVIDIAMDPGNPDTLLVATWERVRDGFDTNDPAKKWGPGAALYKTTDAGGTFSKVADGLPSVYLGRMSISYHLRDPNIVYLQVDSERIGTVSEKMAYMGIVGEDADAGAKLTEITEESPAEDGGLLAGDIVIAVGDRTILSYEDLVDEISKRVAGDLMPLTVSRKRESVKVEVTLGKRDGAGEGRPFGTRLGGQRANIQNEQGPDSFERGGLYRSDNGGDSWTRVNSYNPRPMYFSRIEADPNDPDRVYICGIRFGVTEDGGETVRTNAGPGVHADQHAVWIDPSNSRHIILGCDGGLYVTYDQGQTWDHHNHMAIGQFYHVAIGPRDLYYVYGGLQDNGSWGAPNLTRTGAGLINSDWMRVGGGDGFVCLVDKDDPDQVYFESQNGGMSRINFATGERGSIRPRAPEGTRYRFNWRTPFVLSHHNSRIYYTAGNHVFRSLFKGNKLKSISPEITNTDRGSATALAESPIDEDVLYVGTDDGALWATRDGGTTWVDLFKVAIEEEKPEEEGAAEPRGVERVLQMLVRLDTDGDGIIASDDVPERLTRLFERIDTNADGSVTKEELAAFRARMGGQPPAEPPHEPEAAPQPEPIPEPEATPEAEQ